MLPTPTAIDAGSGRMNRSPSPNASERPTLAMAAKIGLLPTPTVNDATNASLPASLSTRKSGIAKLAMQSGEYRAKAFLALAKLRQLLRVWCEGQEWGEVKYSLYWDDEVEGVAISETGQGSLRFSSLKLAMGFCHCFKDLLSQAPPLL